MSAAFFAFCADALADSTVLASYYAKKYTGRPTASGERYDPKALTAAHPSLPLGTVVTVRRPESGRAVVVRINDRGPARGGIDLSEAAARQLGMLNEGIARVVVTPAGFD
jgi:rare lipoprotein A